MGRYLLLWLLGVPLPILVPIEAFGGLCTETGIPTTHRHSGARDSANPECNDHDRGYGFGPAPSGASRNDDCRDDLKLAAATADHGANRFIGTEILCAIDIEQGA